MTENQKGMKGYKSPLAYMGMDALQVSREVAQSGLVPGQSMHATLLAFKQQHVPLTPFMK